jgi:Rod binding domain-containing protein
VNGIDGLSDPLSRGEPLVEAASGSRLLAGRGAPRRSPREVARDFEAVLLHRLLEEMRRTIPESGLLESRITDQVQGLFWYYLAQEAADKGGLGLARELERQMGAAGTGDPPPPTVESEA